MRQWKSFNFICIYVLIDFPKYAIKTTDKIPFRRIMIVGNTIFNIATTLLLIPFGYKLAKLPEMVLPVLPEENAKVESNLTFEAIFAEDKNKRY